MSNYISTDIVYKILEYDTAIKYINKDTRKIPWTYCVYKIVNADYMGTNIFYNARKFTLDCYKKNYTIDKIKEFLEKVPNVENIELYNYNFDYLPLPLTTKLKQLTQYNSEITNFENYNIDIIDLDYNRLTEIKLHKTHKDTHKDKECSIKRIYCLNVISDYINLNNLQILHLYNCVVNTITELPNLKKLSINDSSVKNIFLENSNFLEQVSISSTVIDIIVLPICIKYLNINRITLSNVYNCDSESSSFYLFDRFVNLESLCIYNDFFIMNVPYIKTLKYLDLNFCTRIEVVDESLELDEFTCLNCDKLRTVPNLCNIKEYTISKTSV